jgi:Ribosomal protein L10
MKRDEKDQLIGRLREQLKPASILVLLHYKGMTVAEMTSMRGQLRDELGSTHGGMQVTKNRLARLALKDLPFAVVDGMLQGPVALVWSEDPVTAAKVVVGCAKKNEKIAVLGGAFGEQLLDADGIKQMASLPSLDELRGKIVGLLQAPAGNLARVIQAGPAQLARVVAARGRGEGAET